MLSGSPLKNGPVTEHPRIPGPKAILAPGTSKDAVHATASHAFGSAQLQADGE